MSAKKAPAGEATYVLTMKDGTIKKVTVPADWKVTFGSLVPGSKNHNENSSGTTALRFYAGASQQKACFVGVQEFRESNIGILERVENIQTEQVAKKDANGGVKNFTVQARESKWVNPDAEAQQGEFKGVPNGLLQYINDK